MFCILSYQIIMPTTLKEFESVWPRIVADLEGHCKQYKLPQQSLDWFIKVGSTRSSDPENVHVTFLTCASN